MQILARAPFPLSFKRFSKHGCKMVEKHGAKLERAAGCRKDCR